MTYLNNIFKGIIDFFQSQMYYLFGQNIFGLSTEVIGAWIGVIIIIIIAISVFLVVPVILFKKYRESIEKSIKKWKEYLLTPSWQIENGESDTTTERETPPEDTATEITFTPRPKKWLGWVVGILAFTIVMILLFFINSRISKNMAVANNRMDIIVNTMNSADSCQNARIDTVKIISETAQSTANSAQSTADDAQSTADDAQSAADDAQSAAYDAQRTADQVEKQLGAKADTKAVEALAQKVSKIANLDPEKIPDINAAIKDANKQIELANSNIRGVNQIVESVKLQVAAHDSAIAKTDSAIGRLTETVKSDTTRLAVVEKQLAKININTDFLILREANRYAEAYGTVKHLEFNQTLVQKFINASVDERKKMWEDLK